MKKLLVLLLAAMAVGLTACGPADSQTTPTPVVTGYEVDLPDGFEALEMEGVDRYYMNADGSNLNVLVSEKTESDDKAFGSVTADALREALEEGFLDSLEAEVDITNVSFTQIRWTASRHTSIPAPMPCGVWRWNSLLSASTRTSSTPSLTPTPQARGWRNSSAAGKISGLRQKRLEKGRKTLKNFSQTPSLSVRNGV